VTPCNRSRPPGEDSTGAERFEAAEALHRQGRLREAEALYRALLERQASHFGSLHNLGLLYAQLGRFEDAVAHLRAALRQNSSSAEAHNNLGNVLASLRRPD
jgi:tetratricopeptide (TPR) repeat protein